MKRKMVSSAVALVALATFAVGTTSCIPTISWREGTTHGVAIETGALRGTVEIYRVPRSLLKTVWDGNGINGVMDALWQVGSAPKFEMCKWDVCISYAMVAKYFIKTWIYQDPWDLKGALFDAQKNYDCLGLTLISGGHGAYNWTHKTAGCHYGGLPATKKSAPAVQPDDGMMVVRRGTLTDADLVAQPDANGVTTLQGAEPDDPNDLAPGSPDPGPAEPVPYVPVNR